MFHGRRTSKMQIVVHRQSLEDNLNRYARYAHDLCKICAKDPLHCCRWSPFVQMGVEISSCIAQLGTSPVCRGEIGDQTPVAGKWGKPRNRSWCQRILTICVLFLQSSSTSMGSSAKPNQPMQCKSARCLHIDNASSLRPCRVDCAHIHQHITLLKIRIKMSNKILQMTGVTQPIIHI